MSQFYQLRAGLAPWGDYGSILRSGLVTRPEEDDRPIVEPVVEIERTGPFMPPITFPFDAIVVTEAIKMQMEARRFAGLQFARAKYRKVVRIDWHEWDALSPEPQSYPESGEPEDYIVGHENCDRTAASMPAIWTFDVPSTPDLQLMGSNRFKLDLAPNADIFREYSIHWVSERMRLWLEGNLSEWVRCVPVNPA
jgi:hypothetical protein